MNFQEYLILEHIMFQRAQFQRRIPGCVGVARNLFLFLLKKKLIKIKKLRFHLLRNLFAIGIILV